MAIKRVYLTRGEEAFLYELLKPVLRPAGEGLCEYIANHSDQTILDALRAQFQGDIKVHHVIGYRQDVFGKLTQQGSSPHGAEIAKLRQEVDQLRRDLHEVVASLARGRPRDVVTESLGEPAKELL